MMKLTPKVLSLVALMCLCVTFSPSLGGRFRQVKPMSSLLRRQANATKASPQRWQPSSFKVTPYPSLNFRPTPKKVCIWITPTGSNSIRSTPTPARPKQIIHEKECSLIVDDLPSKHPSLGKWQRGRRLCVRLSETQLLNKLREVGNYNPRYMAVNKTDACRFRDLTTGDKPPPKFVPFPKDRGYQYRNYQRDSTEGNESDLDHLEDEGERLDPENKEKRRQKRMSSSSPVTTIRGCWSAGSFVQGTGLTRLCTECAATTELPPGVFPPFINEVICRGDHCRLGRCAQRSMQFTFLQFSGEFEYDSTLGAYVEVRKEFVQNINFCCECRAYSFPVFPG